MKFNKNEFGWKEKVSVNTNELATKKYVDDKISCSEEIVDVVTVPLANILSAPSYSVNINTLNLKSGELYIAEFCGITIVSSSYTDMYDVNENEKGYNCIDFCNENFTAYITDKSRYEDEIWVDDDNYAILDFETQIEPTTDFVLKKIILTKPLSSYYLGTHFKAYNSISLGRDNNSTIGEMSSAFGFNVVADGYCSYAEGIRTNSNGVSSHAEGDCTIASGRNSHVEGSESEASGENSHAEGRYTKAEGCQSHAEGSSTTASGTTSHAEGYYTKASGRYQHVQGKYNIEDTENKYAHIVGNGTADNTRSNAHTLDWQGNGWYKGELYTGGTSQSDANKVLTTANISFNESGELVVTINGISKTFVPKQ